MPDQVRRDSLGRRIGIYDTAARTKKTKEKHGSDIFRKSGAVGGKHHGRGYLGKLKAEDPDKFAEVQKQATTNARERNRKAFSNSDTGNRNEATDK